MVSPELMRIADSEPWGLSTSLSWGFAFPIEYVERQSMKLMKANGLAGELDSRTNSSGQLRYDGDSLRRER